MSLAVPRKREQRRDGELFTASAPVSWLKGKVLRRQLFGGLCLSSRLGGSGA